MTPPDFQLIHHMATFFQHLHFPAFTYSILDNYFVINLEQ